MKVSASYKHGLRWLNTVFDTCVSVTFFSKIFDPSVVKNGSKQVNNTVDGEADIYANGLAT